MKKYEHTGLERTPEKTGLYTPLTTPVDVGHLSGGEYNQLHSTDTPPPKKPS